MQMPSAAPERISGLEKREQRARMLTDDLQISVVMRLPVPKFFHPPEVYEAIIREHRESPLRMGEVLMACGWSIGDAAWAAVNWDLRTMAAVVAHERAKRKTGLAFPSEDEAAALEMKIQAEKKPTTAQPSRKTTRIVPTLRINARPPLKPPSSQS